jgi:hypothetical protein
VSTITAAAYASSLATARADNHTTGQLATRRLLAASETAATAAKPRKIMKRALLGNQQQQQQQSALNSYLGSMYLAPLPAADLEVKLELESRPATNVTIYAENDIPGVPRVMEGPHQHGGHSEP